MQVLNVLHAARWKCRTPKNRQELAIWAPSHNFVGLPYIFATKARIDNPKKLVKQHCLPHMSSQYGELGPLAAEICWRVWGTPAIFNRLRILAALLHGTLVVGISQTLRH